MHQFAEYLLGLAAIGAGAQSPQPLLPCVAGSLLLLNAASTDGPLGAFRLVPRKFHRLGDDLLVAAMLLMAILGGKHIDSTGRVVLVGLAFILGFITWRTDYSTKQKRQPGPGGDRSVAIGKTAGRMSGNLVNTWRGRKRS
jgi:hypothetical protein